MTSLPQLAGDRQWFDARLLPPREFVAGLMQIAVVRAAERDRELITHLHPERSRLRKAQVMCVCRLPAANETRLSGDKLQVFFVADALGFAQRQGRLVDASMRSIWWQKGRGLC